MEHEYIQKCNLCLVQEKELSLFLQNLKKEHPEAEITLAPKVGSIELTIRSKQAALLILEKVREHFFSFFLGEDQVETAIQRECVDRKKTVVLGESCTGGALSRKLTEAPGASNYLLGSIVAYSNAFKEQFLHVRRSTLENYGAMSKETVIEMVKGLLSETEADYAVAVSGVAGPSGGSAKVPIGTLFVAIAERGERIDVGVLKGPKERLSVIEFAVQHILGALWRRIVHKTVTFS